eukprot:354460-Chlamydomonas_euryale.AAC.3
MHDDNARPARPREQVGAVSAGAATWTWQHTGAVMCCERQCAPHGGHLLGTAVCASRRSSAGHRSVRLTAVICWARQCALHGGARRAQQRLLQMGAASKSGESAMLSRRSVLAVLPAPCARLQPKMKEGGGRASSALPAF